MVQNKSMLDFSYRFIVYKVPRVTNFNRDGTAFFYMDDQNRQCSYVGRPGIMGSEKKPLYETLKPIYNEVSD